MKGDPIRSKVLAVRMIPRVDAALKKEFSLPEHHNALGLLTTDCDDVGYTALDEATKKASVSVCYARSFYGGAKNANTKLAGEFLGILSGVRPAEVESGLQAALTCIEEGACFYSANDEDTIVYYAHCISRTGSYLSKTAAILEGESLAYLIAPPLEAMYALDAALKKAEVRLAIAYLPPSETNFGGGLLTGSHSSCKAACDAFAEAVIAVADFPLRY